MSCGASTCHCDDQEVRPLRQLRKVTHVLVLHTLDRPAVVIADVHREAGTTRSNCGADAPQSDDTEPLSGYAGGQAKRPMHPIAAAHESVRFGDATCDVEQR